MNEVNRCIGEGPVGEYSKKVRLGSVTQDRYDFHFRSADAGDDRRMAPLTQRTGTAEIS
ncbi:MAG: hypothetical protein ACPGXX_21345 [Planctomycetaceae bacterium]